MPVSRSQLIPEGLRTVKDLKEEQNMKDDSKMSCVKDRTMDLKYDLNKVSADDKSLLYKMDKMSLSESKRATENVEVDKLTQGIEKLSCSRKVGNFDKSHKVRYAENDDGERDETNDNECEECEEFRTRGPINGVTTFHASHVSYGYDYQSFPSSLYTEGPERQPGVKSSAPLDYLQIGKSMKPLELHTTNQAQLSGSSLIYTEQTNSFGDGDLPDVFDSGEMMKMLDDVVHNMPGVGDNITSVDIENIPQTNQYTNPKADQRQIIRAKRTRPPPVESNDSYNNPVFSPDSALGASPEPQDGSQSDTPHGSPPDSQYFSDCPSPAREDSGASPRHRSSPELQQQPPHKASPAKPAHSPLLANNVNSLNNQQTESSDSSKRQSIINWLDTSPNIPYPSKIFEEPLNIFEEPLTLPEVEQILFTENGTTVENKPNDGSSLDDKFNEAFAIIAHDSVNQKNVPVPHNPYPNPHSHPTVQTTGSMLARTSPVVSNSVPSQIPPVPNMTSQNPHPGTAMNPMNPLTQASILPSQTAPQMLTIINPGIPVVTQPQATILSTTLPLPAANTAVINSAGPMYFVPVSVAITKPSSSTKERVILPAPGPASLTSSLINWQNKYTVTCKDPLSIMGLNLQQLQRESIIEMRKTDGLNIEQLLIPDSDGDTRLAIAAMYGWNRQVFAEVRRLHLEDKLRDIINKPSPGGQTPLYYAVYFNKPETAALLLHYGADPNIMHYNQRAKKYLSPIHSPARRGDGHLKMLQVLLASNINVNQMNNGNKTALHVAAEYHGKMTKGEEDQEAYPICNKEIILTLIHNSADLNIKDVSGHSPLHHIINNGDVSLIRDVLSSIDTKTAKTALQQVNNQGNSCLHLLAMLCISNSDMRALTDIMLEKGASVTQRNRSNRLAKDLLAPQHNDVQNLLQKKYRTATQKRN